MKEDVTVQKETIIIITPGKMEWAPFQMVWVPAPGTWMAPGYGDTTPTSAQTRDNNTQTVSVCDSWTQTEGEQWGQPQPRTSPSYHEQRWADLNKETHDRKSQ